MTEEQFLSAVSLLASKHGCSIVDVDFTTNCVTLDGPTTECMVDCAEELERLLNRGEN